MDGVLVDSEPAISLASKEALAEWGIEAELGDFHQFTGMGDDKFIGGVAEKHGRKYDIAMKKRAYEIYLNTAKERVNIYSWSRTMIDRLYNDGFMLAIASASDKAKVECNIACIGADIKKLSAVITGSDVKNKKPAPDIFLRAAEKAGIIPADSLVIEDAVSGVQAAKAAGMICIAVTTSFTADKLYDAGADYIINDLNDAADIIHTITTVN
ncbi:MAG: HAD family hydrolase [Eubacteriales bacterium]